VSANLDPAGREPTEIELKLLMTPDARALLAEHPAFGQATPAETRHQVTAYFDTADFALSRRGISLRVRRDGDRRIQTVKLADAADGAAARRGEWEWPVEQDGPDLGLLAQTPVGGMAGTYLGGALEPVFTTDIRRTVRRIGLDGGTVTEAAFDDGAILAGAAREPVSELELELKDGPPGPLYRFALALHACVPFTIGSESKAARGYRLRTGHSPAAVKAADPRVERDLGSAEAIRVIVGSALGHLLANQPAAAAGDAEGVHQMRVAIRRLRAALVLFERHLEPHANAQFEAELKRLSEVFGAARDWDVFCLETLDRARHEAAGHAWIEPLEPLARSERRAAHHRLTDELGRPAVTGLVLGLAAWSEAAETLPGLLGDQALRRPLADIAPELLDRLARKAARRGRHIDRHSVDDLHALRKSLKKLRYSVDYLGGQYRRRAVRAYLRGCKDLQQLLGTINDAAVAIGLAERLAGSHPGDLAPAVAALATWSGKRRDKARRRLAGAWADFKDTRPFWT